MRIINLLPPLRRVADDEIEKVNNWDDICTQDANVLDRRVLVSHT